MIKQLVLNQNTTTTNETSVQVKKSNNQVISDHTTFLKLSLIFKLIKKTRDLLTSTEHLNLINVLLKPGF